MSRLGGSIIILGSGGMLASALEKYLNDTSFNFRSFSEQQLDITDHASLRAELSRSAPSIIINTAAYTDVDGSEENADLAFSVNAIGAGYVADVSAELGARLVHISTDYVFDGTKRSPYKPGDRPNPQGVYGKSKLAGEEAIRKSCDEFLILRTSWLFGPWGKNFVQTMLNLADTCQEIRVVSDQRGCPTYTLDLAKALVELARSEIKGIHHLSNSGSCSWYEFAETIFNIAGKKVNLIPVTTEDFPRPAIRPENSVLDSTSTVRSLGYTLPSWQNAVKDYLYRYLLK